MYISQAFITAIKYQSQANFIKKRVLTPSSGRGPMTDGRKTCGRKGSPLKKQESRQTGWEKLRLS
jgi:hypothetical protein